MRFTARGVWLAGAVLGVLLAAAPARAEAWHDACPDEDGEQYGSCLAVFAGGPTAETVGKNGDEMIRVVLDAGVRIVDPVVVLEFVLPAEGSATLAVRDPTARGFSRTFPLPRDAFEKLRQHLLGLHEAGAPLHGGKPLHPTRDIDVYQPNLICLDGATALVEAVLHGTVTTAALGTCETIDYSLADLAQQLAEPLDPACALLPEHKAWFADELRTCLHLSGDRRHAAEGYGAAFALSELLSADRHDDMAIAAMFDPRAKFAIGGATMRGAADILARWRMLAKAGTFAYWPTDATARGGQIVVRGMLVHYVEGSDQGFLAPFTQIWARGVDGKFRLRRWEAGGFSAG